MKKVLLIGCLNKTLSGVMDCLSDDYMVQLCPEDRHSVKDMVCLIKPDLIILSQVGMVNEDIPLFDLFQTRYLRTPMLIIALKELEQHFDAILKTERKVLPIYRPVTKTKILEACQNLLKPEGTDGTDETQTGVSGQIDSANTEEEDDSWKSILVVDDSKLVLRNVKRLLKDKYQISIAETGKQAIQIMKKLKIDLVLLDYEMPGWDGKKTLEAMREDPELADIPVIFLTGISEKDHIISVLQLNPAGYLLKPTKQEKLVESIESVLKGKTKED
ncbi:MAG: response regulator [Lachnospiraceae bacterium]